MRKVNVTINGESFVMCELTVGQYEDYLDTVSTYNEAQGAPKIIINAQMELLSASMEMPIDTIKSKFSPGLVTSLVNKIIIFSHQPYDDMPQSGKEPSP
jgi:hypothetical protein